MKYNGIGFNGQWASSVTEDVFLKETKHLGLSTAELKEAYKLIIAKYGDNSGVSKKSSQPKRSPRSGGRAKPNKTVAPGLQQGTDAGGEEKGRE